MNNQPYAITISHKNYYWWIILNHQATNQKKKVPHDWSITAGSVLFGYSAENLWGHCLQPISGPRRPWLSYYVYTNHVTWGLYHVVLGHMLGSLDWAPRDVFSYFRLTSRDVFRSWTRLRQNCGVYVNRGRGWVMSRLLGGGNKQNQLWTDVLGTGDVVGRVYTDHVKMIRTTKGQ